MWISKKKYQQLEKRIADLEGQVQSQQKITEDTTGLIKINTVHSNSRISQTEVSFQLPSLDWYKLEVSQEWLNFAALLEGCRMQNTQMYP